MGKKGIKSHQFLAALIILAVLTGCGDEPDLTNKWSVTRTATVLEISYGQGTSFPQYAALHLNDSYFRMNYGPGSGWGTSTIILPSFWSGGVLHQGASINATYMEVGSDLSISLAGTISALDVVSEIRLHPPSTNSIAADVTVSVSGDVTLDARPGEAFKLVMLSSMNNSSSLWDCSSAFAGSQTYSIPQSGWIVDPPVQGSVFGLEGGTSAWKTNAPTIEVRLNQEATITGWVTPSDDPNNDNAGYWGASNELVRAWSYRLIARKAL